MTLGASRCRRESMRTSILCMQAEYLPQGRSSSETTSPDSSPPKQEQIHMSKHSWSDNAINLVGAQAARFNQTPAVVHWLELKKAQEGVREILRDVTVKMSQV